MNLEMYLLIYDFDEAKNINLYRYNVQWSEIKRLYP